MINDVQQINTGNVSQNRDAIRQGNIFETALDRGNIVEAVIGTLKVLARGTDLEVYTYARAVHFLLAGGDHAGAFALMMEGRRQLNAHHHNNPSCLSPEETERRAAQILNDAFNVLRKTGDSL